MVLLVVLAACDAATVEEPDAAEVIDATALDAEMTDAAVMYDAAPDAPPERGMITCPCGERVCINWSDCQNSQTRADYCAARCGAMYWFPNECRDSYLGCSF